MMGCATVPLSPGKNTSAVLTHVIGGKNGSHARAQCRNTRMRKKGKSKAVSAGDTRLTPITAGEPGPCPEPSI
jgi:hypothetical protein